MKNILLGLFLILALQSFAQSNFRGMSWGASISQLKSKYPDVQWKIENQGKNKIYITEDDYVGGLEVTVAYYFSDSKLQIGVYLFTENHSSDNLYYEDFIVISNILNNKYDMERNMEWNDTTWKDNLNYIGFALKMGDVEIEERYEDEQTIITHEISSDDHGGIGHVLRYADVVYVKKMRASQKEDF